MTERVTHNLSAPRIRTSLFPLPQTTQAAYTPPMNALSGGAVFFLCLFLGIIFDQVAIGILAGLVLGAAAGKATAPKRGEDA